MVVFPYDLKKVGDVRQLVGRVVEISGEVKEYDNRAEMILEKSSLGGSVPRLPPLPPLPKSFDVEERGHFSAGASRAPRTRHTRRKKGIPTLPAEIPEDVESD